ncbi:hypothetical protein [Noviherbaspirillum galbum]|uniref:Thioredoxin-like fold domain-containing protein n=1 Tax=Noviherbaspirillum galbum TaxID=2709383 RepID=A0A6B3SYX0_9BURK|nr:hypothetical protein [Noviherbaspirillum galbum]NEX63399.1 hypothetical protein [Noviherbaspirillum galbum]
MRRTLYLGAVFALALTSHTALAQWNRAYSIDMGEGRGPELTVLIDPACSPCIRAFTDIVSRLALGEPVLARPLRWIPVGWDEQGILAAARALERNSIQGLTAPVTSMPDQKFIEQARYNTALAQDSAGTPSFYLPGRGTKSGYTTWNDFVTWLSR